MYAVMGITGNVGGAVARTRLAKDEKPRRGLSWICRETNSSFFPPRLTAHGAHTLPKTYGGFRRLQSSSRIRRKPASEGTELIDEWSFF